MTIVLISLLACAARTHGLQLARTAALTAVNWPVARHTIRCTQSQRAGGNQQSSGQEVGGVNNSELLFTRAQRGLLSTRDNCLMSSYRGGGEKTLFEVLVRAQ